MAIYKYILYQKLISIFLILIFTSSVSATNIKNSATIFMYHKFGVSKYPSTSVTIEQLESHVEELTKAKYNILPISFIVDTIINDGDLPDNTIGISIDDADKSFFEVGWPLFKQNNIPVTLFVTTGTIANNNKSYLNWNQIRKLKKKELQLAHILIVTHICQILNLMK